MPGGRLPGCNMNSTSSNPTAIYHPKAKRLSGNLSPAGRSALLKLSNGQRFMPRLNQRARTAPRDSSPAIDHEMKRLVLDCVFLDITTKPADFIRSTSLRCIDLSGFGIALTVEPIRGTAAHYTCGGFMSTLTGRHLKRALCHWAKTAFNRPARRQPQWPANSLECNRVWPSASQDIRTTRQQPHCRQSCRAGRSQVNRLGQM